MISNCGHDENGRYSGGQAGDQTGTEWQVVPWYSRPWNCVLRHPNRAVGNMLADLARKAAQNNLIGYDQGQRGTYWINLADSNYDPAQITVRCEADCSSGVAANVKATGYRLGIQALKNVSASCYTGNLRAALKNAGFQVLTASKYLTSDAYLLPGDILLLEGSHTATNLDTGSKTGGGTSGGSGTTAVGDSYTVKPGDTLSWIAKSMGVSTAELAAYNGIKNPDVINVGQVIRKPVKNTESNNNDGGVAYMFEVREIKIGDSGNDVLLAQEILGSRGYYEGALDRKFGNLMDAATKDYQKDRGGAAGPVDGIIGKKCWADMIAL